MARFRPTSTRFGQVVRSVGTGGRSVGWSGGRSARRSGKDRPAPQPRAARHSRALRALGRFWSPGALAASQPRIFLRGSCRRAARAVAEVCNACVGHRAMSTPWRLGDSALRSVGEPFLLASRMAALAPLGASLGHRSLSSRPRVLPRPRARVSSTLRGHVRLFFLCRKRARARRRAEAHLVRLTEFDQGHHCVRCRSRPRQPLLRAARASRMRARRSNWALTPRGPRLTK